MKKFYSFLIAALMLVSLINLPEKAVGQYSLATSIAVGDEVVLVDNNTTKELNGISTTSTKYGIAADITDQNPEGLYPLTVVAGNTTGSFAFKTPDNKYLTWTSGNSLNVASSISDNSSWTVSISPYGYHVATINNVKTSDRQIKYNANSGQERFACYTSGQQTVLLYKKDASLLDNDLALSNAPVALSFDLYNNASAQTISYTTSSTGAVTVSQSDYITASVNASNKTITVAPVAKTDGTQTITVNQAADDNYSKGSVTFTVEVTNSAPQPTNIEANLNDNFFGTNYGGTAGGITDDSPASGTVNNVTITYAGSGNHYINATQIRFYPSNKLKFEAPSGYEITKIVFTPDGTWAATISADNGTYTSGTKTWTGSAASVLFTGSGSSRCDMSKATITLVAISNAVATTTTINEPQNFNTDIYLGINAGILTATVKDNENNTISGATVTWESSNTGVATIDANGVVTLVAVGTTTITANYAGVEDVYRPSEDTYEFTVTNEDPNAPGTQNNPYTVAQAIAATPSSGTSDNVYIHGIVSRFHNNSIVGDGTNYRYYISDDGTSSTELLVYKGKGLNEVAFSGVNDLLVGDEVTIYGGLTTYNNTKEVAANNYIVSLVRHQYTLTAAMTNVAEYFVFVGEDEIEFDNNNQAQIRAGATVGVSIAAMEDCFIFGSLTVNGSSEGVTQEDPNDPYFTFEMPEGNATIDVTSSAATQYTLTVAGLNNVTYTDMLAGVGSEEVTLTNNQATLCEGINVDIAGLTANAGLLLQSVTLNDGTTTTTLKLEYGVYHFTMPSSDATLTFTTITAPTYSLASSIESGKTYIIVGFNGDDAYAMGVQNTNNRAGVGITVDGNTAIGNAEVHEVVITALDGGKYTIEDGGYLYAASSSSNHLKTETTLDDNGKWTIEIAGNGDATITAQGSNNRNLMRFNPNTNNGSPLFACYATNSDTGSLPRLYVKDETPATDSYTLTINGYGSSTTGGWNLIASPVAVNPANVDGMTIENPEDPNYSDFDLYYFDQTGGQNGKEWKNYKNSNFNLELGKGYLYANANTVGLTFTGIENGDFADVENLPYVDGNTIQSLYLAGNSKTTAETFYVYDDNFKKQTVNFLTLNEVGDGFIITNSDSFEVQALQGFFVQSAGQGWTLSTTDLAKGRSSEQLNVKVSRNRGALIDNAIVSFGNAPQLNKFYLFDNTTRVYIPQNGEEMAVVRSEAQGEMPVNFKANQSGEYTISINTENVEMNYLHLIDNLTGNDVDLLATPSYTFNAMADDYASRFRLVFSANNTESNNDNFAFISDGQIVLTEQGNAQVFDVMGRMISRHNNVSHITTEGLAAGVYVIRLTNGSETMTQKIVVK